MYVCGSFNTSRRNWPKDLNIKKKVKKKDDKIRSMKRGDHIIRQSACGKLTAILWMDSKPVFNLSTCYEPVVNKRRDMVQRKAINENGKWQKSEVVCPPQLLVSIKTWALSTDMTTSEAAIPFRGNLINGGPTSAGLEWTWP